MGSMLTTEYEENGTDIVAVFTSADPEGADIVWSLSGVDAGDFTIEGGVLRFKNPPDFEDPKGGAQGTSTTYTVMVGASDGKTTPPVDSEEVTVVVTNMNETGTVMLSTLQPQAGVPMTATLTDPDVVSGTPTWQWARSSTRRGNYTNIDAPLGIANPYAVTDDDINMYLRATATYTDGESSGETEAAESMNPAQLGPRVSDTNQMPVFSPEHCYQGSVREHPSGPTGGSPGHGRGR